MDIAIVGTVFLCLLLVGLLKRSATEVFLTFMVSLTTGGILLTAASTLTGALPLHIAQITVAFSFLSVSSVVLSGGKAKSILKWSSLPFIFLSLIAIILTAFARSRASDQFTSMFSGAGRFFLSEDNDKWLNFVSQISGGQTIEPRDGTGGGIAALLIITTALLEILTTFAIGDVNLAAVNINSVLLSHQLLCFISPLVMLLAIPFDSRYGSFSITSLFMSIKAKQPQSVLFWAGSLTGAGILLFAMLGFQTLGHLSFEYLVLSLAAWAIYMLNPVKPKNWQFGIYLLAGSAFLTWMPIPVFSLAVIASGIVIAILKIRNNFKFQHTTELISLVILFLLMVWLAKPAFSEIIQHATPGTGASLVLAEGATLTAGVSEFLLFVAVVAGNIYWFRSQFSKRQYSQFIDYYPIVFLLGYSTLVALYNLVGHSDGWPHYGTRKIFFGFMTISIVALLPRAFMGFGIFFAKSRRIMIIAVASIFAILIGSFAYNPNLARALQLTTKTWWLVQDSNVLPGKFNLNQYLNPSNSPLPSLANYPVACLPDPQSFFEPTSNNEWLMNNYLCTRFTLAMHGAESIGYPLVAAANGSLSENPSVSMEPTLIELGSFPVLITTPDGSVNKTMKLSQYINELSLN